MADTDMTRAESERISAQCGAETPRHSVRRLVRASCGFRVTKPVCPYCGGQLRAHAEAWQQRDDGTWKADGLTVDCLTEPDIDAPEWREWNREHSYMPYEYMLPIEQGLLAAINDRYDFDVDGANEPSSATAERRLKI